MSRSKLYAAAIVGLLIFGGLVLFDMIYPGLLPGPLSLSVSLGLAICGVAVIALRPRRKRVRPHEAPPPDFTSILEERRRMTEQAENRPPRLPPT
jgi:peptidoglycan/LPS O-acetylase OafA/YrhL